MSTFTTCITNFSRLDRLKECVASLELDKHPHPVAIASFGASPYHSKFIATLPECVTSFVSRKDFGCNRLWIKALELATTKWVSILHDDDRRPAGFADEVEKLIAKAEALGCGFIAWNGLQLDIKTGKTGGAIPIAAGTDGVHDSASLLPMLRAKDSLPNSPVSFLFDRQTALDALYWAEENLKDCTTRPTMMIGNDVALVVAHVQRYAKFLQSSKPLSLYGHWDGSETVAWTQGQNNELLPAYNKARERLARGVIPDRLTGVAPTQGPCTTYTWKWSTNPFEKLYEGGKKPPTDSRSPIAVVVWSDTLGEPLSADTERRNSFARSTWKPIFDSKAWIDLRFEEPCRTSRDFGDTRSLPFIHDMVERAALYAGKPTDMIILINADICLTPWGADVGIDEDDHIGRLAGFRHRLLHHVVDERERAGVTEVAGGPGDGGDAMLYPALTALEERLPCGMGEGVAALRVGTQRFLQGVGPHEHRGVGDGGRGLRFLFDQLGLRGDFHHALRNFATG